MKKNSLLIALVLSLMIIFSACGAQNNTSIIDTGNLELSIYNASEQSSDVSMKAKEYFLNTKAESVPFTITNHSDKDYTYGIEPILEVESDGEWYSIPPNEDAAWDGIGYILQANSEREDILDVKNFYGKLAEGHYRVVKSMFSDEEEFAIAEFEITDQPIASTGAREVEEGFTEEIYGADDREVILKILTSYPKLWSPSDAVQDGCFVHIHGTVEGDSFSVWEKFYTEVEKGNDAAITIFQYTIEGDVIPNYVSYKDGSFYSLTDVSRDKFAGGPSNYYEDSYKFIKQFNDDGTLVVILSDFDYGSLEDYQNDTDSNQRRTAYLFFVNKY